MNQPCRIHAPGRALVFGASGQIGERVLARLAAQGWRIVAVSRQAHAPRPAVHWHHGDLSTPPPPGPFAAIFSCGPLDHFARWYAQADIQAPRIVAFGSTSLQVKQDSGDAHERDLARRLIEAERQVFETAQARNAAATVLRPTLVYGAGRDLTLTRIAALAWRSGHFVLPAGATGRRQPVHVEDLGDAALAVLARPATHARSYALGGGEVVTYEEMVRRVLDALPQPARLWRVPAWSFAAALRAAHALGRLHGMNAAALQRMREDLVFDLAPARCDFGYAPRGFAPSAAELGIEGP
ncbi:MAG: NAD-dependent epimerase/dehydratase family protein [Pseudomonas sp.]